MRESTSGGIYTDRESIFGTTAPFMMESIKMVLGQHVPAIYVEEDTSFADEKLYKCIKNTKLQSYDKSKNEMIVDTFNNHFDVEELKKAFGLGF